MNQQDIDRRSLVTHRIIAARFRAQPELIDRVHANLARWTPEEGRHSVDPCRADRMSALLTLTADF